jgi:hypothetical protein
MPGNLHEGEDSLWFIEAQISGLDGARNEQTYPVVSRGEFATISVLSPQYRPGATEP